MNTGFIFHRNLSTNQPVKLDYDFYFYSAELVESMLDDAPIEHRKLLLKNLPLRNKFVLHVLEELEEYLGKPIHLISPTTYKQCVKKYNISVMHLHLPLFEVSDLEPLVDIAHKVQYTEPITVQNFTKFYSMFKLPVETSKFTPKIKSEFEVLKLIDEYPVEQYHKKRGLITPSGLLLSNYISSGVVRPGQVLERISQTPTSLGKLQLVRQLHWAYYSKLKPTGDSYFPVLSEDQLKKYTQFITGTLQGGPVERFLNKQIQNMNGGGAISNRTRLMLSHYLIVELGLYWEYGELYFRSVLSDYHPKVNRYNWFAQSRNRYLKNYNLTRQIDIHGDK